MDTYFEDMGNENVEFKNMETKELMIFLDRVIAEENSLEQAYENLYEHYKDLEKQRKELSHRIAGLNLLREDDRGALVSLQGDYSHMIWCVKNTPMSFAYQQNEIASTKYRISKMQEAIKQMDKDISALRTEMANINQESYQLEEDRRRIMYLRINLAKQKDYIASELEKRYRRTEEFS